MRHQRVIFATCLAMAALAGTAWASMPPELLNYQGVLRDASDNPRDGDHDMIFRFYDDPGDASCVGGTLLLTDAHEASGSGAVAVSGGMFNVDLGGGTLTSGTATTLAEIFRDHAAVWLEPTVGGEQLCPRIRVKSTGFALNTSHLAGREAGNAAGQIPVSNGSVNANLNADLLDGYTSNSFGRKNGSSAWTGVNIFSNAGNSFSGDGSGLTGVMADLLDGLDSTQFINTSSTQQTKTGALTITESGALVPGITSVASFYGVDAQGNSAGGYFHDGDETGYSYVGSGGFGIRAYGENGGGTFNDSNNTSSANLAYGNYGVDAEGNTAGGFFRDKTQSGYGYVGYGDRGIEAHGFEMGGLFVDDDGSGQANLASGDTGIVAYGDLQAGYFDQTNGSGKALVAYDEMGIEAEGNTAGGYFKDLDHGSFAYAGYGNKGVYAEANGIGAHFKRSTGASQAWLAYYDYGVFAEGSQLGAYFRSLDGLATVSLGASSTTLGIRGVDSRGIDKGGEFYDSDDSGYAFAGYGDRGIHALGNEAGGYFKDRDGSGYAYVGYGDRGIEGYGNNMGGYFRSTNGSAYAYLGFETGSGGRGISAYGSSLGGFFYDTDSTGRFHAADGDRGATGYGSEMGANFHAAPGSGEVNLGYGNTGIEAFGSDRAGYFVETDSSAKAWVAWKDAGIEAWGAWTGGLFKDANATGTGYLGYGDYGGSFFGDYAGVRGQDNTTGVYGILAYNTSSTLGTGAKNFIQNHPYRDDAIIVYAALEGNEVATYTRGSARLAGGEARIALDETFAWVTNPDIGLTAHLTPRSEGADLYVAELTTKELVVRSDVDSSDDATFDYIVYGLRIGFEEVSVVREKGSDQAYIPSMREERERHVEHPEWRKHVPLERFQAMRSSLGETAADLSAAQALRDAIGEYDPAIHGSVEMPSPPQEQSAPAEAPTAEVRSQVENSPIAGEHVFDVAPPAVTEKPNEVASAFPLLPVQGQVSAGDLLSVDETGVLRVAIVEVDPTVVGVVAGEAVEIDGKSLTPVATSDVIPLKVDADLGAVRPGDLLVSSPTPGHAMRAYADIPGTVIAKALEPLEAGRATIRVLVTPR